MTVKEVILWVVWCVAYVAALSAVVHGFDLSREQAGWLEVVVMCVGVLGFVAWQRWWEQGRSRPLGGNRAYLMIIDRDPKGVQAILHAIMESRKSRRAA
jgi:hypothetical protein